MIIFIQENGFKNCVKFLQTNINELPEIVDSNAHFGKTDLFGLLKTPIPIKSILGDFILLLFAHGCLILEILK